MSHFTIKCSRASVDLFLYFDKKDYRTKLNISEFIKASKWFIPKLSSLNR